VSRIESQHLERRAYVYVRQSTMAQVERNTESRERQYELVNRAVELGWRAPEVVVVDADQGCSGKSTDERDGFQSLVAEVGLGRVGIVLGIEVSRLARRNADWYGLLDLCALTDTLIADSDGVYHPGLHNDRLVLGLKGTMSEAELHVLRSRLRGGACTRRARASCACRCLPAMSTTSRARCGSPRTRRWPTRSRPCSPTSISFKAPGR
jgi:DNA invertase Pin-like site-specific DNA recombinase